MPIIKMPAAIISALCSLCACNNNDNTLKLQYKTDSLQSVIDHAYKPGLGEFMSSIQTHHAKLWFAGMNANWRLADFEIHEIMESVDDIKIYAAERPESKEVGMLAPALDTVNNAIVKKDSALFRQSFIALTNTCNNCHRSVDYGFNIVTIPSALPVANQQFKLPENLK
ncbi:MAG TPA: hypothetical protein PKM63_08335 [Panacibacter sp.]|nr:hypothetical protein [Panacibacter sp.]HNP44274.1 hypothetical protein [Panacibacter sp.]